jgi:hypothetical protein
VAASPAQATDSPTTATPTPCASPTSTPTPTSEASATTTATASTGDSATPTATSSPTSAACVAAALGLPTALPTSLPTALPAIPGLPTSTSSPGVIDIPGIGPINVNIKKDCETFNSFSPVKVPCDAQITGIQSFVPNPLLIKATCGADGPDWTITNTGAKELGYGWFDINLHAGIAMIAPGETQTVTSHSIAVIASPWDAATSTLLVAIPAVGYSTCKGATPLPTAIPALLPAATPAGSTAVVGTPRFTG